MEERREQYVAQLRKPLGGMSEETKALLLSDSSSDEEEQGADRQEEEGEGGGECLARLDRGRLQCPLKTLAQPTHSPTMVTVTTGRAHIAKRRGKLTKAERNKQRRRKQAEHAAKRAAEQKAVVKQARFFLMMLFVVFFMGFASHSFIDACMDGLNTGGPRPRGGEAAGEGGGAEAAGGGGAPEAGDAATGEGDQ